MSLDGFQHVVRAGGGKPASGRWIAELQHRAEDALVEPDQQPNQEGQETRDHEFESELAKMPRRLACLTQSAASSAKLAFEALGRAMVTR